MSSRNEVRDPRWYPVRSPETSRRSLLASLFPDDSIGGVARKEPRLRRSQFLHLVQQLALCILGMTRFLANVSFLQVRGGVTDNLLFVFWQ